MSLVPRLSFKYTHTHKERERAKLVEIEMWVRERMRTAKINWNRFEEIQDRRRKVTQNEYDFSLAEK